MSVFPDTDLASCRSFVQSCIFGLKDGWAENPHSARPSQGTQWLCPPLTVSRIPAKTRDVHSYVRAIRITVTNIASKCHFTSSSSQTSLKAFSLRLHTLAMIGRLTSVIAVCSGAALLFLLLWDITSSSPVLLPSQTAISKQDHYIFSNEPHLNDKLEYAEKLWRQTVEDRQVMLSAYPPKTKFPDGYMFPYNVWDFARPSFFCPHDLERVGKLGDGGKIVCGMSRYERESPGPSSDDNVNTGHPLVVYSFGVSDDSSFEAALLQRTNAEIWGYDYSVDSWAGEVTSLPTKQSSRAHFKKAAISHTTDESQRPPRYSIQDLMKLNGHSYVDIVKMDIEGAEFDALTALVKSLKAQNVGEVALPFGQLLIEIHFMPTSNDLNMPKDIKSWMQWFAALEDLGLRPVNNEDNWIGDVAYGKPRFMEVSPRNNSKSWWQRNTSTNLARYSTL